MREMKSSKTFYQKWDPFLNATHLLFLISFIVFALMRNDLIGFKYYEIIYVPLGINLIIFVAVIKCIYRKNKLKISYKNKHILNLAGNILLNITLLILVTIQIML